MSALLLAHPGHWLVNVLYMLPLLGILGWHALVTLRERRAKAREKEQSRRSAGRRKEK